MRSTTQCTTSDARTLLGEEHLGNVSRASPKIQNKSHKWSQKGLKTLCDLAVVCRLSSQIVDNIVFFDRFICHLLQLVIHDGEIKKLSQSANGPWGVRPGQ